jgi:hypothetical protein
MSTLCSALLQYDGSCQAVYSRGDNRLLSRVISTYAFPTYGPRGMDFARSEAKIILDHFEGIESDDVTGRFYSADSGSH